MRGTGPLLLVVAALLALAPAPRASAQAACEAWPGEMSPLPRTSDEAPERARWARMRADELAALARPIESLARVDAHRVWAHVLCLDPDSADARAGLDRTTPVRVHRPRVTSGRASEPSHETTTLEQALAALSSEIRVRATPPAPPATASSAPAAPAASVAPSAPAPPPPPDFGAVDRHLAEAGARMREARFEEALAAAERARTALERSAGGDLARGRRAQAEGALAAAQVALGREADARASFGRALAADPGFRLDAKTTSPRVMRAFDAARTGGAPQ